MIQTDTKPEVIIPEGAELIDEVFYVWETRYGLFSSMKSSSGAFHWLFKRRESIAAL